MGTDIFCFCLIDVRCVIWEVRFIRSRLRRFSLFFHTSHFVEFQFIYVISFITFIFTTGDKNRHCFISSSVKPVICSIFPILIPSSFNFLTISYFASIFGNSMISISNFSFNILFLPSVSIIFHVEWYSNSSYLSK